jgi:hypothetical protein
MMIVGRRSRHPATESSGAANFMFDRAPMIPNVTIIDSIPNLDACFFLFFGFLSSTIEQGDGPPANRLSYI